MKAYIGLDTIDTRANKIRESLHSNLHLRKSEFSTRYPALREQEDNNYILDLGSNCVLKCDKEYLSNLIKTIAQIDDITVLLRLLE